LQKFDLEDMDIPDLSVMPATKNIENLVIPAEEDFPEREIRWIKLCGCPIPKKDGTYCGKNAWNKAAVWSMHGHLSMFSYLMQHLQKSKNHEMSPSEAYDAILDSLVAEKIKVESKTYDFQEREIYRKWIHQRSMTQAKEPKSKKPKRAASSATQIPPADEEHTDDDEAGGGSDDDNMFTLADGQLSMNPQSIKDLVAKTVKQTVKAMGHGAGKIGKADSMGNVKIPLSKLKMLQDAATRAEWAVCTSLISHATTAKKLEAERQNLSATVAMLSEFTGEKDRTMSSTSKTQKSQLSLNLT
jgi:hypothetical protein